MKKTYFTYLIFLAFQFPIIAQTEQAFFKSGTIYLGLEPGIAFQTENSGWPEYKNSNSFGFLLAPYLGVHLHPAVQVGISARYIGRYNKNIDYPALFSAGYYLRYLPWTKGISKQISLSLKSKSKINLRFFPTIQVEHNIWNELIDKDGNSLVKDQLFADELVLKLGASIRLGENIFWGIHPAWYYNLESNKLFSWFPAASNSLQFYINRRGNKNEFQIKTAKSQDELNADIVKINQKNARLNGRFHTLGNLIMGSSYTYIWDPNSQPVNSQSRHLYQEFTWSLNLATDLSKKIRLGFDHKSIFSRSELSGENHYSMTGIFSQYNFLPKKRTRLFLSAMLYRGNICTCDPEDPYQRPNLFYYGIGGGLDIPLTRSLYLDLAWENMNIINKVYGKYNFTQYIIGLDYYLWKRYPKGT